MKCFLLIASVFISSSLFAGQVNNRTDSSAEEVTYCQLAMSPSSFFGKRIRVRAIYSYFSEVSRLKAPSCCPGRDISIWVDFHEDMQGSSKKLLHEFPKGMGFVLATFVGTIEGQGPYGAAGSPFRLNVERIEHLEKKANPPPNRHAVWIPNCEESPAPNHQRD